MDRGNAMKKIISAVLSLGLIIGLSFGYTAEATSKVKAYKNCTELNKVYKGGISNSSKVKNKGGKTKYKPIVNAKLYAANKTKDRDKDGIACER